MHIAQCLHPDVDADTGSSMHSGITGAEGNRETTQTPLVLCSGPERPASPCGCWGGGLCFDTVHARTVLVPNLPPPQPPAGKHSWECYHLMALLQVGQRLTKNTYLHFKRHLSQRDWGKDLKLSGRFLETAFGEERSLMPSNIPM